MRLQFVDMTSSSDFCDVVFFLLSSLVTDPNFMSISLLVPELWQSSLRNLAEVQKLEVHPSEFCQISGDWGKLGIPNMAQVALIKCYWMLQNVRVTLFIVSELLSENQQGR